ncbi:MarR family winged helix-turn-helix transcriptional regulator [Rhizohabitans arisaemae]|uniref:MarR family winged helix-turn-helix transcriptional regulator n=1 Tax=Rhizohabitans arisaemae TaxID=2720610 RepID=UPI0024B20052|nr:MarR family transcriptional regulator [Rhizohabitans arisaemae]
MGLTSSLAYLLSRAERTVNRGLAAVLAGEQLSVEQWRVLQTLADGSGYSMGDLAETVLIPHPTLTKIVDRLVESGLVYRGHDPADRRRVVVYLADRGAQLLGRLDAGLAEYHRHLERVYGSEPTRRLMQELSDLADKL